MLFTILAAAKQKVSHRLQELNHVRPADEATQSNAVPTKVKQLNTSPEQDQTAIDILQGEAA
jgi:DNA-binding response OmpR family regulator